MRSVRGTIRRATRDCQPNITNDITIHGSRGFLSSPSREQRVVAMIGKGYSSEAGARSLKYGDASVTDK
jgi:hypothetical protein